MLATLVNIPYAAGGGHKQQLDLYVPAVKGFPTIVWVHGGSLESGDRTDKPFAEICENFVRAGVGCAKISYRLAPENKWPAMPNDVAGAFAWVKRHIAERGGDPSRVFLAGHSSGCFLVSIVGTDERYLRERGLSARDVAGIVAMGCTLDPWDIRSRCMSVGEARRHFEADLEEKKVYRNVEDRIAANPSLYIGKHVPPFLAMVAEAERFHPSILEEAAAFVRKLLDAGGTGDVLVFNDREHYTLMEGLAKADDPAFIAVRKFVLRP